MPFENSPIAGSMPYRETDRRRTNWIPFLSTAIIIALLGTIITLKITFRKKMQHIQ